MQTTPAIVRKSRKDGEKRMIPLLALNKMVDNGRVELLSHPLCLQYLDLKWKAYGSKFYFFGMAIYMFFVLTLTALITSLDPLDHICATGEDLTNCFDNANITETIFLKYTNKKKERRTVECFAMLFLMIFAVSNIIKEFVQMYQQRYAYFADITNYQEWTLYLTVLIFVWPPALYTSNFSHSQWQCGIIATFTAWYSLLLYLQRLDSAGIYVVMFLHIFKTMMKVILVFSVLIIAYGLSFYLLLSHSHNQWNPLYVSEDDPDSSNANGFHNPWISIIHTVMMMMGDSDFLNYYVRPLQDDNTRTLHFPYLSFYLLITFMLLVPILFINLLIGLAVGDIEMVQKDAKMKRLAMQVEYHTELELKLPQWILEKIDINTAVKYRIHPNALCGHTFLSKIINGLKNVGGGNLDANQAETTYRDANVEILTVIAKKQKDKIAEIQNQLDKQYQLIRLIVQKMEIKTESDNFDEGCYRGVVCGSNNGSSSGAAAIKSTKETPSASGFSQSRLRAKMIPIVEVMKKQKKHDC